MQKYGFVYIWFDKKHKRYYVGSHWGSIDDGYICSSSWMKRAYKLRSQDFKRRIIKNNLKSKLEMFNEEQRILNMIKKEEISPNTETPRYYNLRTISAHWSSSEEGTKNLSEKISIKTKEAMQRPEVRQKYLDGLKNRDLSKNSDPEIIERKKQKMLQIMAEKFPLENRKQTLEKGSHELNEIYKQKSIDMWKERSEEQKKDIIFKLHEANKNNKHIRSAKMSATKWYNNGIINTRKPHSPGPGWVLGRI